jgi:hypothetical protein
MHGLAKRGAVALGAALLLAAGAGGVSAQVCGDTYHGSECDDEPRQRWVPGWQEGREALPALPAEQDLVEIFPPRGDTRYQYFVDRNTITASKDGVMRYSVVVRSSSGAENTFREGLRCETDEVKGYGYASARNDGTFTARRGTTWRPMAFDGARAYQEYLAQEVLCDENGWPWSVEQAQRALSLL